jgi:hypothetical protein
MKVATLTIPRHAWKSTLLRNNTGAPNRGSLDASSIAKHKIVLLFDINEEEEK